MNEHEPHKNQSRSITICRSISFQDTLPTHDNSIGQTQTMRACSASQLDGTGDNKNNYLKHVEQNNGPVVRQE